MTEAFQLEDYREYLALLGRMQLPSNLAAKVDVDGIVQTTMVEAHQQREPVRGWSVEEKRAWLRKIFSNNLIDEIRKFRAKSRDVDREQSMHEAIERSSLRLDGFLLDPASSPSQKAMRNERAVKLATALACLTPAQRQAIELHHLQELPLAEVGKRMNRGKGAVAALIFRGSQRLRELLSNSDLE